MNEPYKRTEWQRYLPQELRERPIKDLIFPGSHDSGAYKLERVKLTTSGWPYWGNKFAWIPKVKNYLKRWTLTQELTIAEQLKMGIRRLDFRIVYSEDDAEFYLAHTFACVKLSEALAQINDFMHNHPYEVLYINARRDFESGSTMKNREKQCLDYIVKIIGDYLVPQNEVGHVDNRYTLQNCYESGKRIFFFYTRNLNPKIWHERQSDINRFTDDLQKKIDIINTYLDSIDQKNPTKMYGISITLTPSEALIRSQIPSGLFCCCLPRNASTKNLTKEIHAIAPSLLRAREWAGINKMNTINFDFPTTKLVDMVVGLNLRKFK